MIILLAFLVGAEEEVDTAHLKSPHGEADTSDAMAAGLKSETSSGAHGETTRSADNSLNAQGGETFKIDDGGAGDANCAHKRFVTEETSQETDLSQGHVNEASHVKNGSPQTQCSDNVVEATENEGKLSADNPPSSQTEETSEQLEEVNRAGGEQGDADEDGLQMRDSHGHSEDGGEEDDEEEENINADSAKAPLEDAEETSVSEKSGDKNGR